MSIKVFYMFFPMDFLRDTEKLSLFERLLYREMLDLYWIYLGEIYEKEVINLAKKRGFTSQNFNKCWVKVSIFFPVLEGKLTNPRMDRELDRARLKHQAAVENGRAGGLANASKNKQQKDKQNTKQGSSSPPSLSLSHKDSGSPGGETFTLAGEVENPDLVFEKPMEWASHLARTYGYSREEVQTDKTIPAFKVWCASKVTTGEFHDAMLAATSSLGALPDSPMYINKIIKRMREHKTTTMPASAHGGFKDRDYAGDEALEKYNVAGVGS